MSHDAPLISAFVLNWNGTEDTIACLESLRQVDWPNLEVVLIDNGSTAEQKQRLADAIEQARAAGQTIRYIDLPKNTGFTGGNIAALAAAKGQYCFLVNNDCVVAPDILRHAMSILSQDEKVAVVGGRAFFWNEENPAYSEDNKYYTYQYIDPISADAFTLEDGAPVCEPNNVSGSAVVIRRSVLDVVGFFDDDFFAYYEETDLFARMKRAGFRVVYSEDFKIWHKVGQSTKKKKAMFYYLVFKNQFLYAAKNFDDDFFDLFVKSYVQGVRKALFRLRHSKDITINRAKLAAAGWNIRHWRETMAKRRQLADTYGPGYSRTLIRENAAPLSVVVDGAGTADEIDVTLHSLGGQRMRPSEVVVVLPKGNHHLVPKLEEDFPWARVVLNKELFETTSWAIGFVCTRHKWLMFLQAGDVVPDSFVDAAIVESWTSSRGLILGGASSLSLTRSLTSMVRAVQNSFIVKREILTTSALATKSRESFLESCFGSHFRRGLAFSTITESIVPRAEMRTASLAHIPSTLGYRGHVLVKMFRTKTKPVKSVKDRVVNLRAQAKELRLVLEAFRPSSINTGFGEAATSEVTKRSAESFSAADTTIIINCRDRVEALVDLVAWLERNNLRKIVFLDNGSTYPPLLEFFAKTPYQVLPLGRNSGHKAPWDSQAVVALADGKYYVVTDPDVVPDEGCPPDAINHFQNLLRRYPQKMKVGFGLRIDDLPDHYRLKQSVIDWEKQFWQEEVEADVYIAAIDTTFALYRPNAPHALDKALRTGGAYVARHVPWYMDSSRLNEEEMYYRLRLDPTVNTWNQVDINHQYKQPDKATATAKAMSAKEKPGVKLQ